MSTPAVLDDYLQDLLGDAPAAPAAAQAPASMPVEPSVAAVTAAPAPTLAVAPVRTGAEADLISDDEFEALLDELHGSGAPAAVAVPADAPAQAAETAAPPAPAPSAPAPALAVAPTRPGASADLITDDEFEALLDELHGGGAPAARVADATPAVPAAAAAPAAPAAKTHAPAPLPPAPSRTPPLPEKPYLQPAIDTGERRRATERKTRWLRLRCDQQHYALELLKVQEVVLPATLLPLRGAAPHMLGVMNLRGQVVPVIDLGLYLGREPVAVDATTRIVVLEEQGEILGLRVTAVEDVASLTDHQIESPDNARVGRLANPLFRGVARLNERAVILLDASQLLK